MTGNSGNNPGIDHVQPECAVTFGRNTQFTHFMEYRVPSTPEQIRHTLAIEAKKTDTLFVRHLTVEELQSILDASAPAERDGIRDRAMLVDPSVKLEVLESVVAPETALRKIQGY